MSTGPSVSAGLERLIASAQEDLADRLSIAVADIEVVEARPVLWPDASAGSPVPGMRYKQVPVDGALIRLRAGAGEFEYHFGGPCGLLLCTQMSESHRSTSTKSRPRGQDPVGGDFTPPSEQT